MRKSFPLRIKRKQQIAIIVDGKCESWYFSMLARNESTLNVTLQPKLPQKKKLVEQFKEVEEASNHFDKVFWIVDFDKLHEEHKAKAKGVKSPIQEFREFEAKLSKIPNISIIVNSPCLEFWFLLHFEKTNKFYDNCDSASKRLKKFLPDYDKSQDYFTKNNNDIYLKLRGNLKSAVGNAKSLGDFDFNSPNNAISEMFKLFKLDDDDNNDDALLTI